ncbi:MAG: DUF4199 domain-containing protein [Allosphingosinicella sp.]
MRYALVYGGIAGAIVVAVICAGLIFDLPSHATGSMLFGYLVMLVALTLIFVGVKRFRDVERGGVIRFLPALGMGLAIATVAAITYVVVWETYLAATDYAFFDEYLASMRRAGEADRTPAAELAQQIETMRGMFANPLVRIPITFMEIFPVGLVVALVSAALLRNPRLLPARYSAAAKTAS